MCVFDDKFVNVFSFVLLLFKKKISKVNYGVRKLLFGGSKVKMTLFLVSILLNIEHSRCSCSSTSKMPHSLLLTH